jgi:hypothetical protein
LYIGSGGGAVGQHLAFALVIYVKSITKIMYSTENDQQEITKNIPRAAAFSSFAKKPGDSRLMTIGIPVLPMKKNVIGINTFLRFRIFAFLSGNKTTINRSIKAIITGTPTTKLIGAVKKKRDSLSFINNSTLIYQSSPLKQVVCATDAP